MGEDEDAPLCRERGSGSEKDLEIWIVLTRDGHPMYPKPTNMCQDKFFWNLGFLSEFSLKDICSVTISGVISMFL